MRHEVHNTRLTIPAMVSFTDEHDGSPETKLECRDALTRITVRINNHVSHDDGNKLDALFTNRRERNCGHFAPAPFIWDGGRVQ